MTAATETSISLAWEPSIDDVGLAGYRVYTGDVSVGATRLTAYTFIGLSCGTTYVLGVEADDLAGNASPVSTLQAATASCTDPPPPPPVGGALPPLLPPSTGATFYVSTSGSDSNPGTEAAPWRTIRKALDTLAPGQTALVHAGTYTQDLEMTRSGTASDPITVSAYPGEQVILHPASPSGDTYPVQIYSAAYFRLSGFVIEDSLGTSSANVYLSGSSHDIEISDNEIRYGQDSGVFAESTTSNIYLLGNNIHDNGWNHLPGQHQSHGIYIEGSGDLIANNLIYDNPYGFGIQIYPANHDTTVVDNTVLASSDFSSIVVGGSGGVYNITLRNNILYGGTWGVDMDSTCPTGTVSVDTNDVFGYSAGLVEGGCSNVVTGVNVLADPLFVNLASRDLHLQLLSPALSVALPDWSMASDFDGDTRPQGVGPDVGAYES